MKVCTKCNLEKNESEFYQVKGRYIAACKECTKKQVHNYADNNKDKISERSKEYRQAHVEEKRAADKKWRTENKEYKAKIDREYRANNLDRCREQSKKRYYERVDYWLKLSKERFAKRFEDEAILKQLRESSKKYSHKIMEELTDVYVARAIWSNLKGEVPIEIIKQNKELIELKRFEIKFNRNLKQRKHATSKQ